MAPKTRIQQHSVKLSRRRQLRKAAAIASENRKRETELRNAFERFLRTTGKSANAVSCAEFFRSKPAAVKSAGDATEPASDAEPEEDATGAEESASNRNSAATKSQKAAEDAKRKAELRKLIADFLSKKTAVVESISKRFASGAENSAGGAENNADETANSEIRTENSAVAEKSAAGGPPRLSAYRPVEIRVELARKSASTAGPVPNHMSDHFIAPRQTWQYIKTLPRPKDMPDITRPPHLVSTMQTVTEQLREENWSLKNSLKRQMDQNKSLAGQVKYVRDEINRKARSLQNDTLDLQLQIDELSAQKRKLEQDLADVRKKKYECHVENKNLRDELKERREKPCRCEYEVKRIGEDNSRLLVRRKGKGHFNTYWHVPKFQTTATDCNQSTMHRRKKLLLECMSNLGVALRPAVLANAIGEFLESRDEARSRLFNRLKDWKPSDKTRATKNGGETSTSIAELENAINSIADTLGPVQQQQEVQKEQPMTSSSSSTKPTKKRRHKLTPEAKNLLVRIHGAGAVGSPPKAKRSKKAKTDESAKRDESARAEQSARLAVSAVLDELARRDGDSAQREDSVRPYIREESAPLENSSAQLEDFSQREDSPPREESVRREKPPVFLLVPIRGAPPKPKPAKTIKTPPVRITSEHNFSKSSTKKKNDVTSGGAKSMTSSLPAFRDQSSFERDTHAPARIVPSPEPDDNTYEIYISSESPSTNVSETNYSEHSYPVVTIE